ncbi:MAG: hypothetical protein ABR885_18120, partial [Mycobacterium sp.]
MRRSLGPAGRRRWLPILLAWVFVVELVAAAAVPFDAARDRQARPAQLIAPTRGASSPAAKPLVVRDRSVR